MKNVYKCLSLLGIPTNPLYIAISTMLMIAATSSIVLTVVLAVRFHRGTVFHRNVKILLYLLLSYGTIFNLMFDITYVFHIYHHIFNDSKCSTLFYTTECAWSFISLTTCIIGFILIHAGFAVERVIATCRLGQYERRGKCVGPAIAIVVVVLSILAVMWGMGTRDPNELQYQCAGIPLSSKDRMISIYSFMLIIDVSSMTTFTFCYYYNKKKLNNGRFRLDLRYEVQENLKVINILLPVVVVHFLLFGFFIIGSILIRRFRADVSDKTYGIAVLAIYIIPYYILVMCILIYGILLKESREILKFRKAIASRPQPKQDEGQAYFESLQKQWNGTIKDDTQ